jgi:hypothetical protein
LELVEVCVVMHQWCIMSWLHVYLHALGNVQCRNLREKEVPNLTL